MKTILYILILLLSYNNRANAQILISTNTTWNTNQTITQNVEIAPGATLTISNCTILLDAGCDDFSLNTDIITNNSSAKLVLQNCSLICINSNQLTNLFFHGEPSYSQSSNKQPTLQSSGSYIENCSMYFFGGGVAKCINTNFVNNVDVQCVTHDYYYNFLQGSNPVQYLNDQSYYVGCTFSTNKNNLNKGLVYLFNVKGIGFSGNVFSNPGSSINYNNKVSGIKIFSGGAIISNSVQCNSINADGSYNCAGNTFNTDIGIRVLNNSGFGNVLIGHNTFNCIGVGVYADNATNIYVFRNNFNMAPISAVATYGAYIFNTSIHRVWENTITVNPSTSSVFQPTLGILIDNCGGTTNEVYKNTLSNCYRALNASRFNRKLSSISNGLKFACNTLSNSNPNAYDMYITISTPTPVAEDGIANIQGEAIPGTSNYKSLANVFSVSLLTGHSIYNNANSIDYYGNVPNGFSGSGGVNILLASNITCPSKVYTSGNSGSRTLSAAAIYHATKQSIWDSLAAQQGTSTYAVTLEMYEKLVHEVINEYTCNSLDSTCIPQYDLLDQLLNEVPISGYYTNARMAGAPVLKKNLIEYHLMRAGLLVQFYKYEEAIAMLNNDVYTFALSKQKVAELQQLIALYQIQKKLHASNNWESLHTDEINLVYKVAYGKVVGYGTSAARYILALYKNIYVNDELNNLKPNETYAVQNTQIDDEYDYIPLVIAAAEFKIRPNPATTFINIPSGAQALQVFDIITNQAQQVYLNEADVLDVSKLNKGIYYMIFTLGSKQEVVKFSKE